jgi:Zn-dependent alcohol dehydrogenase
MRKSGALDAEAVRDEAVRLVQRHASRLGMDAFAAEQLARSIAVLPVKPSAPEAQLARICAAVEQYREAPFRSADWLAGELLTIVDTAAAND